jgi:hypothetical protein
VVVPRRTLLAALSIGATASSLPDLRDAMSGVPADENLLAEMTRRMSALQSAGRVLAPARLVDSLTGQVAVVDVVRRRAPAHLRRDFLTLQAQYGESLSWMAQESGDLRGATSWVALAEQWGAQAQWPALGAYAHMRRSHLASTYVGDGPLAVEHA